jgi:MYXO-CTERM domain-containing protein
MRPLLLLCAVLLLSHAPNARALSLSSEVEIGGQVQAEVCVSQGSSGDLYHCGIDVRSGNGFGESDSSADTDAVDLSGSNDRAFAAAGADSDGWVNQARARVTVDRITTDPRPEQYPQGGIEAFSGEAQARAVSSWQTGLTFLGRAGIAVLELELTGTLTFSPLEAAGAAVGFSFLFDGTRRMGYGAGDTSLLESTQGGMESEFGPGSVNEVLSITLAFLPGVEYQAQGILEVAAKAAASFEYTCADLTRECSIGPGVVSASADSDFYSTLVVRRLVVPAGVTPVGENGSPLPFSVEVPEPGTASLALAALVLAALRRRRCAGR